MGSTWPAGVLERIGAARELEIATERADGTRRRWTPIWVVRAGDRVYVRSWHRRDAGWFGDAVRSRRARIRVPGVEADVTVTEADDRASVDAAYRAKYGETGSASMVTPSAAAATLRLDP